jgi:hypothetical protein
VARTEPKEIRVARINFWQAVVVALISAAVTVLGVIVSLRGTGALNDGDPAGSVARIGLRIRKVEFDLDARKRSERGFRVVATVNGHAMSFPSNVVWAKQGQDLSSEVLAVEKSDGYNVRLEAFAIDSNGNVTKFISRRDQRIPTGRLPDTVTHELVEEGSGVDGRIDYVLALLPVATQSRR